MYISNHMTCYRITVLFVYGIAILTMLVSCDNNSSSQNGTPPNSNTNNTVNAGDTLFTTVTLGQATLEIPQSNLTTIPMGELRTDGVFSQDNCTTMRLILLLNNGILPHGRDACVLQGCISITIDTGNSRIEFYSGEDRLYTGHIESITEIKDQGSLDTIVEFSPFSKVHYNVSLLKDLPIRLANGVNLKMHGESQSIPMAGPVVELDEETYTIAALLLYPGKSSVRFRPVHN